jgi:hypothetical protein
LIFPPLSVKLTASNIGGFSGKRLHGSRTITHGAEIGLGSLDYELVRLE